MSKRPGIAALSAQPRGVEADTPLGELLADLETIASYEETLREKIEVCPGVGPKRIIDTAVRIREAAKLLSGAAPQPPGVDVGKLRELVGRWRDEANAGYLTGKPEIDSITEARQHVYFECADKLDATMAEPGVKK